MLPPAGPKISVRAKLLTRGVELGFFEIGPGKADVATLLGHLVGRVQLIKTIPQGHSHCRIDLARRLHERGGHFLRFHHRGRRRSFRDVKYLNLNLLSLRRGVLSVRCVRRNRPAHTRDIVLRGQRQDCALAVLAHLPPRALRLRVEKGVGGRQRVHQATQRCVQDVAGAAVIDGIVAAWAACIDADG